MNPADVVELFKIPADCKIRRIAGGFHLTYPDGRTDIIKVFFHKHPLPGPILEEPPDAA
jgi:hypothetical protein